MKDKKKRSRLPGLLIAAAFIIGICLLLYPTVGELWNSYHSSKAIVSYSEQVNEMESAENAKEFAAAEAFNKMLAQGLPDGLLSESEQEDYNGLLNPGGSGIMGVISIPKVGLELPIYHGTEEAVLQVGAGHIEWSSLPIGGESTHSVISGHSGLPSARLFTDIGKLEEGDKFYIRVLDRTLTYEVDQIRIVLPEDTSDLAIQEGKDYCTLVTCTPYGINSHRLLVRGRRIENAEDISNVKIISDAVRIDPYIVSAIMTATFLFCFLFVATVIKAIRKRGAK